MHFHSLCILALAVAAEFLTLSTFGAILPVECSLTTARNCPASAHTIFRAVDPRVDAVDQPPETSRAITLQPHPPGRRFRRDYLRRRATACPYIFFSSALSTQPHPRRKSAFSTGRKCRPAGRLARLCERPMHRGRRSANLSRVASVVPLMLNGPTKWKCAFS